MEPVKIALFTFRLQLDPTWVKKQVYNLASRAEVVVKEVREVEEKEKRTRTTMFRKRTVEYDHVTGYTYYVKVVGPPLNVEKFEHMVSGFIIGYCSHHMMGG